MLLKDVEVDGRVVDVRVGGGTVREVGDLVAGPGEEVVDGRRGPC